MLGTTRGYTPRKINGWNLRIPSWKRKIVFQTIIFRFYVNLRGCTSYLGGGNSNIWLFSPRKFWKNPFWRAYFFKRVVEPPTIDIQSFKLQTCVFTASVEILLRIISEAEIVSLNFNTDGDKILTGSFDNTAKVGGWVGPYAWICRNGKKRAGIEMVRMYVGLWHNPQYAKYSGVYNPVILTFLLATIGGGFKDFCYFVPRSLGFHDSIKNWMGPYQRTPKEVARAIRFSGLGVRSVGPVGDFLEWSNLTTVMLFRWVI